MPGRVNLIGEHTDYNGLPVMPTTIEREIRMLVAPRLDRRVDHNTAERFEPFFRALCNIGPYATGD